jgi:hypothetical protein
MFSSKLAQILDSLDQSRVLTRKQGSCHAQVLILIDPEAIFGLATRNLIRNQRKLVVLGGVTLLLVDNVYIGRW